MSSILILDTWTLKALSKKMNLDPQKLRRLMNFWIDRGVLKEIQKDTWIVLEVAESAIIDGMCPPPVDPDRLSFYNYKDMQIY